MFDELKKRRIELGKTIEEIAEITKIKKSCIQNIEEGNFDQLPAELYTKSYIRTYAEILQLDPEPFIKCYENYLKAKKQPSLISQTETLKKVSSKKNFKFNNLPRWAITSIIILSVFVIVLILTKIDNRHEKLPLTSNIETTSVAQKSNEDNKIKEEQPAQKPTEENKITPNKNTLKIEATDEVWMRITIDGKEKKEFLLKQGQSLEFTAEKFFKVHIGNAGGVKVYFNDKDLGKIGEKGQVVYLNLPEENN